MRVSEKLTCSQPYVMTSQPTRMTCGAVAATNLVFATANGTPRDKDNARQRIIRPVIERADKLLDERGQSPLPAGVTAHKLRHTYASILIALGGDPAYVMGQLGHADARGSR